MLAFRSILLAAAVGGSLSAQSVIIPSAVADGVTEGNGSGDIPFARTSSTQTSNDYRVQFVYDTSEITSTAASGPILINGLRFRADDVASTTSWVGGTYAYCDIRIGASAFDYTAFTTNFANNYLTGEPAPAYSGPVVVQPGSGNGVGTPGPWYITINLATPVPYDATQGNDLIIDIANDGDWTPNTGTSGGSYNSDYQTASSPGNALTRRMYSTTWTSTTGLGPYTSGSIVVDLLYTPPGGLFPGFTVDKTEVFLGEVVKFTDTSFSSAPGGITQWAWDFTNDGIWDSTNQNPTWTYFTCGPKTVTLRVRDGVHPQAFETKVDLIDTPGAVASFTATPTAGPAPLAVQFTDTSTTIDPGGVTAWAWDFEDDGFVDSTLQNPLHVYGSEGVFTARLTAFSTCGSESDATTTIDTRVRLCTVFDGTGSTSISSGGGGNFFDLEVLDPAGVTITSIDGSFTTAGASIDAEVWVKPGTSLGNEADQSLWSLVATGTGTSAGAGVPTPIDLTDFCLPQGLWGVLVFYRGSSGSVSYDFGTAGDFFATPHLLMTPQTTARDFFGGSLFGPVRTWEGCIYYQVGGLTTGSVTNIGAGCPSSAGRTASIGGLGGSVPRIDSLYTVEMSNAPPSQPLSAIIIGFTNLGGAPLGGIGMPGCNLYPVPDASVPAPTDALGMATIVLQVPGNPALSGNAFYCQGLVADLAANPFGAILSNAGAFTVGCK